MLLEGFDGGNSAGNIRKSRFKYHSMQIREILKLSNETIKFFGLGLVLFDVILVNGD